MINLFVIGGPFMWILLLITLTVLTLSIRDAVALFTGSGLARLESRNGSGAILFWGCIAAVLGFLGSLSGLYLSMSAIRQAGVLNPALLAQGIAVALITTIFGLLVLAFSAIAWFILRWRLRKALSLQGGQIAASA
jgi:biopolymer transport protein ExbB/TolQ